MRRFGLAELRELLKANLTQILSLPNVPERQQALGVVAFYIPDMAIISFVIAVSTVVRGW